MAIIAILLALDVPSLSRALEGSRQLKCVSNLRQIGAAIQLYANDNDGLIVPGLNANHSLTWETLLTPYIFGQDKTLVNNRRAESVFACPDSNYLTVNGDKSDYGLNVHINSDAGVGPFFKLQSLTVPSKTIAAAESLHSRGVGAWGGTYAVASRHSGKGNVLFFDMHVETMDPATLLTSQYKVPWAAIPN